MITKVEALNEMLGSVSQRIVTSATNLHPVAREAEVVLDQVNKTFQSEGWDFNRSQVILSPAVSTGHITLPADFLDVDPQDVLSDLTIRAGKLFDPINNTYVIGVNVPVFLTVLLDVGDMPHAAASYMTAMATEIFYSNRKGDTTGMTAKAKVTFARLLVFQKAHARRKDFSSLNTPQAQRMLSRRTSSSRNPHNIGG